LNDSPGAPLSGAVAFGLSCSVLAAMPALARVLPFARTSQAACVLVAAASLVVVPLGLWLRLARALGLPATDRALLAGTALSSLPLALFGGVLKSTTHHRPLGGATFAVAALCVLVLCVGLSFRVLRGPRGRSNGVVKFPWQSLFTLGCGLSLASTALLGTARSARPSLLDFGALLAAAVVAGVVPAPASLRRLRLPAAGVAAVWVALLACAVVSLRNPQLPQLVGSLATQAPVCFAPLSWLGGGS
jgi:hypothetical protein